MKINKIKATAIAISAAAIALCPTMATLGNNMAASAATTAFISDTDYNGALNIDESQISVNASSYRSAGKQITAKVSNGVIKSTKDEPEYLFNRSTITINVSGTKFTADAVKNLNSMKLNVVYKINGGTNKITYSNPKVTKRSNTSYDVNFEVIIRGDSFTYETSKITGVTNLSCSYASIASHAGNYWKIEVKTPNGENMFINIRNNGKVRGEYMRNWAKRLCMLVNSLSNMTGVKLGTMYMLFDEECGYGYSANWYIKEQFPTNGFVAFNKDATDDVLRSMATGNNEIPWAIMHELAHSYAIHTSPSRFNDNYGFYRNGGYFDEYLTNVRALTAIQNCDNLRNMDVYIDSNKGKYNKIFHIINPKVTDPCFYFAMKLTDLGERYGWDKLEKYYAASSDYSYTLSENKTAAAVINEICGTSVSTSSTDFLKFTNTLRTLYKLCWNHTTFDRNSFKTFVQNEFGKDCIKNAIKDKAL